MVKQVVRLDGHAGAAAGRDVPDQRPAGVSATRTADRRARRRVLRLYSVSMIERRPFGRTGHLSSATLFGGAALAQASQADADRTLEVLLRYGVNHIDTAARYGDSELRIAPWMARHRKDFFLATKTGMRTAREAREDLYRSLDRLQGRPRRSHPDALAGASRTTGIRRWGPAGALEALVEARGAGADALHRRHRPRLDDRGHAPAQPGPLRFRLDPAALQLLHGEQRALPPRLRGRAGHRPRAPRGGADHQVHRAGALGHHRSHAHHLVSAARVAGRHRPRRALGDGPPRRVHQHRG